MADLHYRGKAASAVSLEVEEEAQESMVEILRPVDVRMAAVRDFVHGLLLVVVDFRRKDRSLPSDRSDTAGEDCSGPARILGTDETQLDDVDVDDCKLELVLVGYLARNEVGDVLPVDRNSLPLLPAGSWVDVEILSGRDHDFPGFVLDSLDNSELADSSVCFVCYRSPSIPALPDDKDVV